jgi:hypothetical protein
MLPMERKRPSSREALSDPASPALDHGGLFPRLPRSLQSACVAFLSCDDAAEIDLVSKAGRELCRVYFERIERCVASGRAAQTLALRFACRLREHQAKDLPLQLRQKEEERLRSLLGLGAGASILDRLVHRNHATLEVFEGALPSLVVLAECPNLRSLGLDTDGKNRLAYHESVLLREMPAAELPSHQATAAGVHVVRVVYGCVSGGPGR